MLNVASLVVGVAGKPATPARPTHKRSIVRITASNFGGDVNRTSITYLKTSGNASGSVNLPMPIKAAPTTSRRYGRRNRTNLKITDLEILSATEFIKIPVRQMGIQAAEELAVRKQRTCL